MKFSVGYQCLHDDPFPGIIEDYREDIEEVYFAWPGQPSGRTPLPRSVQETVERDLGALGQTSVRLCLLLNANCYGNDACSESLRRTVGGAIDGVLACAGRVDAVTTASPAVAHTIGQDYPDIVVRASVNMRIGATYAMSCVADLFDSFCVRREYNRDRSHLRRLRFWANSHGKELVMLVNSGCLYDCPGQTFHDNLVAHEPLPSDMEPLRGFQPAVCWRHLTKPENHHLLLAGTWIRPEDLHHYEGIVSHVKLATRQHRQPRLVLEAYTRRRHRGNLLDLMEPSHSHLIAPARIDNTRFPEDWFERTEGCSRECERCGVCGRVYGECGFENAESGNGGGEETYYRVR